MTTNNLPQNRPPTQQPNRRDFLTRLALAAAAPRALFEAANIFDKHGDDPTTWPPEYQPPTAPGLPLGRDFDSLEELQGFIDAMRSFIDAEAERIDQASAEALASEINRRIVENAVLCAHIADRPELRDRVLSLLHLDSDTAYDIALMADDYRRHPEYPQSELDRADLRRHLWGCEYVEIPGRVTAKTWDRYEFEQSFMSGLGGGYKG